MSAVKAGDEQERLQHPLASGASGSANEVIREALRALDREEAHDNVRLNNVRLKSMVDEALAVTRPPIPMEEVFAPVEEAFSAGDEGPVRATITILTDAERDLHETGHLIEADSPPGAARFVRSIGRRTGTLSVFPESGRAGTDLGAGVRGLAFDRRVLVVYRIDGDVSSVLRVSYEGQDIGPDDIRTSDLA